MALVSMKLSPTEAKAESGSISPDYDAPEYPYGLSIYLDADAMSKLGIDKMEVGTEVTLSAKALVTGYSERASQSGSYKSTDIQITDMEMKGQGDGSVAARIYNKS